MAFKGFRRRWIITPSPSGISAAVEDDYHCMAVAFDHDGVSITGVRADMHRWPWSTCPGAEDVIRQTFTGVKLADAAKRGEKTANCTHLYDLALLAARHALDAMSTRYDAMIADPIQGVVEAELLQDDVSLLHWTLANDEVIAPSDLAGTNLFALKDWIASQSAPIQEAARLLQWATLIAHGREIPMERQSDATRMPPNCFTFQPDRAKIAVREGRIYDFSDATAEPLSHFDGGHFRSAPAGRKPIWPPA